MGKIRRFMSGGIDPERARPADLISSILPRRGWQRDEFLRTFSHSKATSECQMMQ